MDRPLVGLPMPLVTDKLESDYNELCSQTAFFYAHIMECVHAWFHCLFQPQCILIVLFPITLVRRNSGACFVCFVTCISL